MWKKPKPLVIILILSAVLLFIIGIRLGKKIERIDQRNIEQINQRRQAALLSKQKLTPTTPPFALKKFFSPVCGLQFFYPAGFAEYEQSTDEARLTYQDQIISVHCNRSKIIGFIDRKPSMQSEGTRKIQEVDVKLYEAETPDTLFVFFTHPINEKNILMRLPRHLLDLFEATVLFQSTNPVP